MEIIFTAAESAECDNVVTKVVFDYAVKSVRGVRSKYQNMQNAIVQVDCGFT